MTINRYACFIWRKIISLTFTWLFLCHFLSVKKYHFYICSRTFSRNENLEYIEYYKGVSILREQCLSTWHLYIWFSHPSFFNLHIDPINWREKRNVYIQSMIFIFSLFRSTQFITFILCSWQLHTYKSKKKSQTIRIQSLCPTREKN